MTTKNNTLQYDEKFINRILSGDIDSYGENSPVNITVEDISKGKASYYQANQESIKTLLNLLISRPKI